MVDGLTAGLAAKASAAALAALAHFAVVGKAADETVNASTAFQDDNHLAFAVEASKAYAVRGRLFIDTPAAADFKFQFTGPASPTLVLLKYNWIADGSFRADNAFITAFSSAAVASWAATSKAIIEFDMVIQNGANAGTVTLQWAQNAASGVTTVYAGSYLEYRKLN